MTRLPASQAFWIRRIATSMPFYRYMGIRLTKIGWGRSEIRMIVSKRLTQGAGFAHGGVSASLIDSAVGLALCTMIESWNAITTIDLQVNFLAPAKPGLLTARGRVVHKGRRIGVGEAEVTGKNGKLISKGTATYMILEKRTRGS